MRNLPRIVLSLLVSICALPVAGCHGDDAGAGPDAGDPAAAFTSNCTVTAPTAESARTAGHVDGRSAVLPGGRLVTPTGTLLDVGGYPLSMRLLPGGRYAVVTDGSIHDQALRVVDLEAADPRKPNAQTLPYPLAADNGMFFGLALSGDGKRLYLPNAGYDPVARMAAGPGHYNTIEVFDVVSGGGGAPMLVRNDALLIKLFFSRTSTGYAQRVPGGLQISDDGKRLLVACEGDDSLAVVSLEAGPEYGLEIGTAKIDGIAPYDVAVDEPSHTAFVSLWGGQNTSPNHYVHGVVAVDITDPRKPVAAASPITTGKASEAELLLAGRLYVANADADTLSVIDAASRQVKSVATTTSMILGASPNNLAIDPGGPGGAPGRIYIANANENAVVVLDLDSLKILGAIPTAWYPTAVAVRPDGGLAISSARGLGYGPSDGTGDNSMAFGVIQVLPRPSDAELIAGAKTVQDNIERPRRIAAQLQCPTGAPVAERRFPLPAAVGAPSPIKYVFLVVRENKTYDSLFGDLDGGNGDPSLTMWTPEMIPNARDLAKRFVLLDNFYSHAELSVQGHEWTTGCIANDYVEKAWGSIEDYGREYRSHDSLSGTAIGSLGYPGSDSIWVHLDKAGVRYHNYGEVTNILGAKKLLDPAYPGFYFNTGIEDVKKVDYITGNIFDSGDDLEPFSYMLLPNDHTSGTKIGSERPASMMADNDEATGRLIDRISHSPLWPRSLIIVIEDDPGGGGDHVEQHRSICLMASPWLKRGYHSSSMFDIGSVYATIDLILGVNPMNVYDGNAAPMYELFTDTPDLTPYTHIPRKIPVTMNQPGDPLSEECGRMDFSRPDAVDLSRVLWKVTHGKDAEPPWLNGKRAPPPVGRGVRAPGEPEDDVDDDD